jgi:hypothetical protein
VPVAARYAGLTVGSHTFGVRAKDAAGNVDATPATFSWTIASGGGASVLLAGNGTVEAPADEIQIRQAEAWPVTASASGTAGVISVYLDSSTTVNDLQVALYANNNGVPGTRLAVGTTSGVTPGGWVTVALNGAVAVTSGSSYWLAVMSCEARAARSSAS